MSQQLESLLGADRRAECEKHDAEMAADQAPPAQHTDDWHRRNDRRALELQVADFRERGWM
jgi:hypothetical protein